MTEEIIQSSIECIEYECLHGHKIQIPVVSNRFVLGGSKEPIDIKDEKQKMLYDILKDQDYNIKSLHETVIPMMSQNTFLQEKVRLLEHYLLATIGGKSTLDYINKKLEKKK